jgi:hypothetical protein
MVTLAVTVGKQQLVVIVHNVVQVSRIQSNRILILLYTYPVTLQLNQNY